MNKEQENIIKSWKSKGAKIVFTNGCFDILHAGHIAYLTEAKNLGDKLILGLNSDASVSRLKGNQRPIVGQEDRQIILSALKPIDLVILFEEDTPLNLIKMVQPDILVKGGDYTVSKIVGYHEVKALGGEVLSLQFKDNRSSSMIIEKIKNLNS